MAFEDPQVLDGIDLDLTRVSVGDNKSIYVSPAGDAKVTISHIYGKRTRRMFRLDYEKVVDNPLMDGVSTYENCAAYIVLDAPPRGLDNSDLRKVLLDVSVQFENTTEGNARAAKFLGGQS